MKKGRIILLIILLIVVSTCICFAATETENQCADALYELGLFKGTGVKTDGSPEYSLDRVPNRAEAITMLVRLLGKETEAKSQEWKTPFTDVPDWAKPYVGYAYNNGLTNGTSKTLFGSASDTSETQYLTFVLRTLGYNDANGDFVWNKAKDLSNSLGITSGEANGDFVRGSVVEISYSALSTNMKNSDKSLADKLIEDGVIDAERYNNTSGTTSNDTIPIGDTAINSRLLEAFGGKLDMSSAISVGGLSYYPMVSNDLTLYETIKSYMNSRASMYTLIKNYSNDYPNVSGMSPCSVAVVVAEYMDGYAYHLGITYEDLSYEGVQYYIQTRSYLDGIQIYKMLKEVPIGEQSINEELFNTNPYAVFVAGNGDGFLYHFIWKGNDIAEELKQIIGNNSNFEIYKIREPFEASLDGEFVRIELSYDDGLTYYSVEIFNNKIEQSTIFVSK